MGILTTDEVIRELRLDDDFDKVIIEEYIAEAASFLTVKTGHDFTKDSSIDPLVKRAAKTYIRMQFADTEESSKYGWSLDQIIGDIQDELRLKACRQA